MMINDEFNILGLTVEEAYNFLPSNIKTIRATKQGDIYYCMTCDFRTDRVDVWVDQDDKIIKVIGVG